MQLLKLEELIIDNMPLVKKLARIKKRRIPANYIQYDDLVSAGYLGLVKAARKYDEKIGPFPRFAVKRILGEMSDCLWEFSYCKNEISMEIDFASPNHDSFEEIIEILPESEKRIFRWYYVDGLTCKQIGEKLGVGESWVSQRMTKCKRILASQKEP